MTVVEVLKRLKANDINVFTEQGKLKVDFEKGKLTGELKQLITDHKQEIIRFIQANSQENEPMSRAGDQKYYALSCAQKRIYYSCLANLNQTHYHIPLVFLITGALDVLCLEKAFNHIIERHESLRTKFEIVKHEPVQMIAGKIDFKINYSEKFNSNLNEECQKLLRPFHFEKPPLLRVNVIKNKPNQYILLIDLHHIIADGISIRLILSELEKSYHDQGLDRVIYQYKDFSEWEEKNKKSETYLQHKKYWLDQFSHALPGLELPLDFKRPVNNKNRGQRIKINLAAHLHRELKKVANQQKVTLFTLLLSIYFVLLNKYTGQDDITVATVTDGRMLDSQSSIVGMFVNTLPIRSYPEAGKAFSTFLAQVKQKVLNGIEHQAYPYNELITDLNIDRTIERNPLFDTLFLYHNFPEFNLGLKHCKITPVEIENKTSKFDLTFEVLAGKDRLDFLVEYNTDLLKEKTIRIFVGHFVNLIQTIVNQPGIKLRDLEIISSHEKKRVLYDFNATHIDLNPNKTIHSLFEEQVLRKPQQIAALTNCKKISYKDLNHNANQIAHFLDHLPIKSKYIAILIDRSIEMIEGLLGIMKAGAAYVPLDTDYPAERISYILSSLQIQHIITNKNYIQKIKSLENEIPGLKNIICLDVIDRAEHEKDRFDLWSKKEISQFPDHNLNLPIESNSVAYVIYTSGSTGYPKGVMVNHSPVINLISWVNKSYHICENDKLLFITSLCFDLSVYDIFGILAGGGTIRIASQNEIRDIEALVNIIQAEQISFWDSAPAFFQQILFFLKSKTDFRNKSLRLVFLSGDWIPVKMPDKIRKKFVHSEIIALGGATEAVIWSNYFKVNEIEPGWVSIPYGKPISNAQYYILDKNLKPVPIGVKGDLYIGGKCLASGYVNDQELTAKKFINNPFINQPNEKIYQTGDLARWFPDGNIEFLGRNDFQVKVRGYRIEIGEIEYHLCNHSKINKVIVILKEIEHKKYLSAFYTAEMEIDQEELRRYLETKLPQYMIPAFFIGLDQFPLTGNGKIDRKKLANLPISPDNQPVNPFSHQKDQALILIIKRIWKKVLLKSMPRVLNQGSNFFEAGGDSIDLINLLNRINNRFQLSVTVSDLYQNQTIAEQGQLINKLEQKKDNNSKQAVQQDCYQTTVTQKKLYQAIMKDNSSKNYNVILAYSIQGKLDFQHLKYVLRFLCEKHELLRTQLCYTEHELVHKTLHYDQIKINRIKKTKNHSIRRILRKIYQSQFDLNNELLFKVFLIQSKDKQILVFLTHHIIFDGISMNILHNDFVHAFFKLKNRKKYQQLLNQHKSLPWREYVDWINDRANKELNQQKSYWIEKLEKISPVDMTGNQKSGYAGKTLPAVIDAEKIALIDQICSRDKMSKFTLISSFINYIFARLKNHAFLISGLTVAGRNKPEFYNTLGYFRNIILWPQKMHVISSFKEYLKQAGHQLIEIYTNQEYPFDFLRNDFNFSQCPYQIGYVYENQKNFFNKRAKDHEHILTRIDLYYSDQFQNDQYTDSKIYIFCDLLIYLTEKRDQIDLLFKYSSNIKEETIKFLFDQFIFLIQCYAKKHNLLAEEFLLPGQTGIKNHFQINQFNNN